METNKMRTTNARQGRKVDNSSSNPLDVANNEDKCLLCYGPHSGGEDKGPHFELKNLKEIFTKSFGIQFLPHFNHYGQVHMCSKCHEEFLKVEAIYEEYIEVEKRFDAVREKFAFIVVDSIFKSDYINNYAHGNAFDAVRCLVAREWSERFKKQPDILKKPDPQQLNGQQPAQQKSGTGIVKDSITITKSIPPSKPISIAKTTSAEKEETPNDPKLSVESSTSKTIEKEVTNEKQPHQQKTDSTEELLTPKKEMELAIGRVITIPKSTTIESKKHRTKLPELKPMSEEDTKVALSKQRKPSGEKEKSNSNNNLKSTKTSPGVSQKSTIVLSADGQKLISASGGKLPANHKVIFVKRDPTTGKMIQVAKPPLNGNALTLINDHISGKVSGKMNVVRTSSGNPVKQQEGKTAEKNESTTGGAAEDGNKSLPVDTAKPHQYPYAKPQEKRQVKVVKRPHRSFPTNQQIGVGGPESPSGPKIISVKSVAKSSTNNNSNITVESLGETKEKQQPVLSTDDEAEKKSTTKVVKETVASNGTKHSELKPSLDNMIEDKETTEEDEHVPTDSFIPTSSDTIEPSTPEVNDEKGSRTTVISPESRSGRRRTVKRVFDSSNWASGVEMEKLVSQYVKGGLKSKNSPKRPRNDSKRQKSVEPDGLIIEEIDDPDA